MILMNWKNQAKTEGRSNRRNPSNHKNQRSRTIDNLKSQRAQSNRRSRNSRKNKNHSKKINLKNPKSLRNQKDQRMDMRVRMPTSLKISKNLPTLHQSEKKTTQIRSRWTRVDPSKHRLRKKSLRKMWMMTSRRMHYQIKSSLIWKQTLSPLKKRNTRRLRWSSWILFRSFECV